MRDVFSNCFANDMISNLFPHVQRFMSDFKLAQPIIQAPMAGADNNALAIAVSELGGMGARGMGYNPPAVIEKEISLLQKQISNHFNINLFIPNFSSNFDVTSSNSQAAIKALIHYLEPYARQLNCQQELAAFSLFNIQERFQQQLDTVIHLKPAVLSITLGTLPPTSLRLCQQQGIQVIATATTLAEGKKLSELGYDAIIAQGLEAGGHRGSFINSNNIDEQMDTLSLVKALAPICHPPIIAAGGIRSSKQIAEYFHAGASSVQIGTAFLACSDCTAIPPAYQRLITSSQETNIALTSAISGGLARGIKNSLFEIMENFYQSNHLSNYLPYPLPHLITAPLRKAAAKENNAEFMAAWSGKSTITLPASSTIKEFMKQLICEIIY